MTADELHDLVTTQLGFTSFWTGKPLARGDLSADQSQKVRDAEALYIQAHPSDFSTASNTVANEVASSGIIGRALADDSFTSEIGTFVDEVGKQAVDLNNNLNPFSARNRGYVLAILLVAGGVFVYYKYFRK